MGKQPNRRPTKKPRTTASGVVKNSNSSDNSLLQELALASKGSNNSSRKEEAAKFIKKLSDPDAGNRAWAASVVSTIASNDPIIRKSLLASDVLGHLISLLEDPVQEVVVEALGTLRNLASLEDPGIPNDLFNKKIFSSLHKLMEQTEIVITAAIKDNSSSEALNMSCLIAENVISILWSIAETSTKLLNQATQDKELEFIMLCLTISPSIPISLADTAARCLLTVSENNEDIFKQFFIRNSRYIRAIETVFQFSESNSQAHSHLKILAAGILSNFHMLITPSIERQALENLELANLVLFSPTFYATLLPVVAENICPSSEIASYVEKALQQKILEDKIDDTPKNIQENENKNTVISEAVTVLTNHHVALEILSSLTSEEQVEDEEQNPDQDENMDCDSENEEDDLSEGEEDVLSELNDKVTDASASEIDPLVIYTLDKIVPKLQALATSHPLAVSQTEIHPQHKALADGLVGLHQRALACLNSLFSTLVSTMPSSLRQITSQRYSDGIRDLWDFLFQQTSAYANLTSRTADQQEALCQGLACLWSLARFGGHVPLNLTSAHLDFLVSLVNVTPCSNINVTAIGILGFIAQRRPGFVDLNKRIGDLLMSIITPLSQGTPQSIELALGALNAIYDIYDDKVHDYDSVFVNGNYLSVLRSTILPLNKTIRNIDRRKDRDLRGHAEDTLLNLKAFVKYKSGEAQS